MKRNISTWIVAATMVFVSCNSNSNSMEDHSKMNHNDSMPVQTDVVDADVKTVQVSFTSVDPGVAAFMKDVVQYYLALKNALVDNNVPGAASASAKMLTAIKELDKSLFTAEQKKVFDDVEAELKEHAEHIEKNKLDHQRQHFSLMSEELYTLVKAFGAGKTLYHDHCPMALDDKGAMWLSEAKEIRNPYFGDKMMTCGTVEEMFK